MTDVRKLAILLSLLATVVALAGPWRHVTEEGLCIFEPCLTPIPAVRWGYESGGLVAAGLGLLAASVLAFAAAPRSRYAAVGLLGACFLWALAAPLFPSIVVFGHEDGPAWGAGLTAGLAALALLASWALPSASRPAAGLPSPAPRSSSRGPP